MININKYKEFKMKINVKKISDKYNDIPLPEYSTEGSSGMDIRAALEEPTILEKGKIALVPTNLIFEIPLGYEIQVRPRSGLAVKNGITVFNTPGTIDSDYRGELKVILINFGNEDFTINRGDRIAQIVLSKIYKAEIEVSEELNETSRNSGGFGHSGIG